MKYRKWPAEDPEGAIVLVHGMGAGTERWEGFGRYFQERNISSYAVSLKGFDSTEGESGYVESFNVYHEDIKELFTIARHEAPVGKVYLLGESMGAIIAFTHAAKAFSSFDGYILISPAFRSKLKFTLTGYIQIAFSMLFFPKKRIRMPFTSNMCTSDEIEARRMENDPSEHRYASGSLLREIFKVQVNALKTAGKIISRMMFLISMNDEIADAAESIRIFDAVRSLDKEIRKYPGMKHALSVETGKEEVFSDIYKWAFVDGVETRDRL